MTAESREVRMERTRREMLALPPDERARRIESLTDSMMEWLDTDDGFSREEKVRMLVREAVIARYTR